MQQTIERAVSLSGVGIHTGEKVNVTFKPANVDYGVEFVRTDIEGKPGVFAVIENVSEVFRGTTLKHGAAIVQTVEHLLATLYGLGIDNLIIEINNCELPIGDGSAKNFADILQKAGLKKQEKERKYFTPSKIILYKHQGTELVVIPSDKLTINAAIDYTHKFPGSQFFTIDINKNNYLSDISSARTYCFESEIKHIQKKGLGKGGTYENTVVIGKESVINTELRFSNEFVRHKSLDLLGDLFLLGVRLKADIIAIRNGHASNIELTKKLKQNYLSIQSSNDEKFIMNISDIMKILPHRYPFLLVDKITMDSSRKVSTGYKNVTVNEPFFKGHFPLNPVFPRTLIIEFIAQSSAVMLLSRPELREKLAYFLIIEKAKFFDDVKPLDMLVSKVELVRERAMGGKVSGIAYVKNKKVAEADFVFALIEKD